MRIVLIHRYFWPDTPPYAHILREIALELGRAGHDVTVLTCQPSYNRSAVGRAPAFERLAPNVVVRRWRVLPDRRSAWLKVVNLVVFCLRIMARGLGSGQVDVVMAASAPPIAVAKTASWLARAKSACFVSHKQDIYPEVVLAPGIMRPGLLASVLRGIDSRTDRGAARVVVLSADMAETEKSRGVAPDRIAVINNFDPWGSGAHSPSEVTSVARQRKRADPAPLSVVFAGNLGRFQNLETVIETAALLRDESHIVFHFFGDGAMRPGLERRVADDRLVHVHVHGYQPPERVGEFLRAKADLGIVSLAPGVIRAAYPSKTMSYLRQGCAVMVLVEGDTDLARTIASAGAGFHSDPSDAGELAEALRKLAERREVLVDAGVRARALYDGQFNQRRQLARWLALFEGLQRERAS
jgi:glycosyltransferase involved in cell wall biosynthesis